MSEPLLQLAESLGVASSYIDMTGQIRPTSDATAQEKPPPSA